MRIFINILSILVLIGLITGFVIKSKDEILGDRVIGITILAGAFVLMPSFIIYRSKGKKIKDYMLTNENLKKMKDYKKEETNRKRNKK
ncbi:MAG TPA: hypothetical protein VKX30_05725 [Flavobacteriaceae bacterium]|nr:hypothetical protein [Flavobacteriaceae bacterium]